LEDVTPSGPALTGATWVYQARAVDPDGDPVDYAHDYSGEAKRTGKRKAFRSEKDRHFSLAS
jgi:hypothetical protein